jgi:hypothetical protein
VATWDDLIGWVRVRYEVTTQRPDGVTFRLPTAGERTQLVHVRHRGERGGHDWIQIESPIARLDDIDVRALLELAESTVAGGAAAVDGVAVFRHGMPLDDLSPTQFEGPFRLVTEAADALEQQLTGVDRI